MPCAASRRWRVPGSECIDGLQLGKGPYKALNRGNARPHAMVGYNPLPAPKSLQEGMVAARRTSGWTIAEAARHLGVDAYLGRLGENRAGAVETLRAMA